LCVDQADSIIGIFFFLANKREMSKKTGMIKKNANISNPSSPLLVKKRNGIFIDEKKKKKRNQMKANLWLNFAKKKNCKRGEVLLCFFRVQHSESVFRSHALKNSLLVSVVSHIGRIESFFFLSLTFTSAFSCMNEYPCFW